MLKVYICLTIIVLIALIGFKATNAQTGIPDVGPYCGDTTICVAFSVAMNDSHGEGIINYNQILVNQGDGYDSVVAGFSAPENGYYWTHISVGVEAATESDVYTLGTSRLARLTDSTANSDIDTLSRDEIFFLGNLCGSMQALSLYPVYSDELLQTSMTGFSIATVSQSAISFSVALSSNTACAPGVRVPFDVILHDTTPNGWNNVNKEYLPTKRGTYVISLMVGSIAGLQQAVGLYVNVAPTTVISGVEQGSTNHDVESQSQLVAIDLEVGYSLYAACGAQYASSQLYGSKDYQTILSGFLYEPAQVEYAWSVASTTVTTGAADPLPMPVVLNNKGQFWNQLTHAYEVKRGGDGIYYMHITAGINTGAPCQLDVVLNNQPIFNIYRPISNHNGVKTRSRALLYQLRADDIVKLRVPAGASVYSSQDRLTMFTGFRLYAI